MIASNLIWINKDSVSEKRLAQIRAELTIFPTPSPMDLIPPDKILQFVEDEEKLGVPFAYGEKIAWEEVKDETSLGFPIAVSKFPDPEDPRAPKGQKQFFDSLLEAVQSHYSVLAVAPTGTGKTVAILNTIGKLKTTALVVVPSVVLAEQWRQEAVKHIGLQYSDIGMLKGSGNEWKGKSLVIAVIHNLFLKEWGEEFKSYFGLVAWDECHKLGARVFASTMFMFNSRYKLAVTATPNRKDGCDAIYKNYFGEPLVVAKSKALKCDCYVLNFQHIGTKHFWISHCRSDVKPLKWLSSLPVRNDLIVKLAKKLYEDGRNVLILSKFIDHVELLIGKLVHAGVPAEVIGQFTRSTSRGKKHGQPFLDKIKAESKIIVGTYVMMKEGVDIPRLDAGIEALPVADCVQAIGRIRRPCEGKQKPKWFSIVDKKIAIFEAYSKARFRGFEKCNVDIKELEINSI